MVIYVRKTGILVFGRPEDKRVKDTKESLRANNIPFKEFTGKEVCTGQ